MPVLILRPSLYDINKKTVLRGVLHVESLAELRIDASYQREILSRSSRRSIELALDNGAQLPDIELGMRGERWRVDDQQNVELLDPVFIIDGQQRRATIIDYLDKFPEEPISLGAVVHFNSNSRWERERFRILNTAAVKVSPSVLLRGMKDDVPALATLYGLSRTDREFPLYGRVGWGQNLARSDLLSSKAFTDHAIQLHAHFGALIKTRVTEAPIAFRRLEELIGLKRLRENVIEFWGLIEYAWGLRALRDKRDATYLRGTFLRALVQVLSDHVDFWPGESRRLIVPYEIKAKLRKFPMNDPSIITLAGAGGRAKDALIFQFVSFLNSGKQPHKRLTKRDSPPSYDDLIDDQAQDTMSGDGLIMVPPLAASGDIE